MAQVMERDGEMSARFRQLFLSASPPDPQELRLWGHSSAGRAPALQAGCRRFESDCLHQARACSSAG